MQGAEYNDLTTIYEGKQIIEGECFPSTQYQRATFGGHHTSVLGHAEKQIYEKAYVLT